MEYLVNRLVCLAKEKPNKPAVIFKKETLTYRGLCLKFSAMATLLKQQGVRPGSRVCFSAVSRPEMVAAYIAIQSCGAIAVFLDKNGTPGQMADICIRTGAALLLTDKPLGGQKLCCPVMSLRSLYQQADIQEEGGLDTGQFPEEDDTAEILFTTGTTGISKGVILTYRSVYHILSNTVEGIGIREDDCLLLPLPLHHSFALRVLRAALYQGSTVVLQNGFTFAKEAEHNIETFGCNALAAVPSSFVIMKSQMQEAFVRVLGRMRYIEFAAGALSIRQRKEITAMLPGVQIYNTWGSSETGGAVFCDVSRTASDPDRAGMLGKPLPGVLAKIVDADGNEIKSDASHPGRLALKGDMLMSGYWNQPELTRQVLKDGWFLTGDVAYKDADGFLFMLGRADDIINTGGEKVSPVEVEEAAGQYTYIRECACIGADDPDGVLGQVPVLFASVKNGYTEDGFLRFLSLNIERWKIPKKILLIQEIPRNQMYKPDRRKLRMMWENRETLDFMNPVMQAILGRRSVRTYTEQKIPQAELDMILKAGYHAPSGHNMQSWRFTVLTSQSDICQLKEKTEKTAKEHGVYFYGWGNPNVMVLVSNDERNPDGCQDASCAAQNIMLAAYSYGIGSVWLNPLKTLRMAEPVKSILDSFGIPQNHIIWAAVALGYPVAEGAALKKKADVIRYIRQPPEIL